jgi:hypothetical protein
MHKILSDTPSHFRTFNVDTHAAPEAAQTRM